MKKVLSVLFVSLFCAASVFAAALVTPKVVVTSLAVKSDSTVENAIYAGCKERNWAPTKISDGEIKAFLESRGHTVTVTIRYSKTGYTIEYRDSSGMKYNSAKNVIHSKYNVWVANLDKSIKDSVDYSK